MVTNEGAVMEKLWSFLDDSHLIIFNFCCFFKPVVFYNVSSVCSDKHTVLNNYHM